MTSEPPSSDNDDSCQEVLQQGNSDVPLFNTLPGNLPPGVSPLLQDTLEREVLRSSVAAELFGEVDHWLKLGRFRLLTRLGEGGMGTVYTARDDSLDRDVAVKVLREDRSIADTVGRERLLREAKALASISHTNVVAVHEVGDHEGRLFIAMELVRGQSLDVWLREQPRSYSEVLDVFIQAATGLEAAHRAGLVHRDFKPHNAILSDTGVVKVLDFGLVSGSREQFSLSETVDANELRLTMTGAMLGTPAYMSPEQFRGHEATPASDQFSLCSAIYEGLYGYLPFCTDSLAVLTEDVLAGNVRSTPRDSGVPAWLHRVILRGLSLEPEHRYRDMGALIAALRNDPAKRRRRFIRTIFGAVLVAATSVGFASMWAPEVETHAVCTDVSAPIDGVWNDDTAAIVRETLTESRFGGSDALWEKVETGILDYLAAWRRQRESSCRKHDVGGISDAQYDRGQVCLDRDLARLEAIVEQLRNADASVIELAPTAIASLPLSARCDDAEYLLSQHAPPANTEVARVVEEARTRLARARGLIDVGKYELAQAHSDAALAVAQTHDFAPLLAEAELSRGVALLWLEQGEDADRALTEAFHIGLANDHAEVACEAIARRLFVRSELLGQPAQALRDIRLGTSLYARVPGNRELGWLLENNAGATNDAAGETDAAGVHYEQALALCDAAGDQMAYECGVTHLNIGLLHERAMDLTNAAAHYKQGFDAVKRVVGPRHPTSVIFMERLASVDTLMGKIEGAHQWADEGIAVVEMTRGRDSIDLVPLLLQTAALESILRRKHKASELAKRAVRVAESQAPINHALVIDARFTLGEVLVAVGDTRYGLEVLRSVLPTILQDEPPLIAAEAELRYAEALLNAGAATGAVEHAERALDMVESVVVPQARELAQPLQVLAAVLLASGPPAKALAMADRALDILGTEKTPGVLSARLRVTRAGAQQKLGRVSEALLDYNEALTTFEEMFDANHPELAALRFKYARVLEDERARSMATAALGAYTELGAGFESERAEVEAWMSRDNLRDASHSP